MTETPLQNQFRRFVDDDSVYERFVHASVRARTERQRLRYWQGELWAGFTRIAPEFECMTVQDVLDAFFFCPLHGCRLTELVIHIPANLVTTTVSSADPDTPYGYRHPFLQQASSETRELRLDSCDECMSIADARRPAHCNHPRAH